MCKTIEIHIEWDGPFSLKAVGKYNDRTKDRGVYQVYGGHPVFGCSVLLYVGRTTTQSFSERIAQEKHWVLNSNSDKIEIHLGRLAGAKQPSDRAWQNQIVIAERLLIAAHFPPWNSQKALGPLDGSIQSVHVLNWKNHRSLLPEVSGARWNSRYDQINGYRVFGTRK